jgi:hypothetical protein
MSIIRSPRVENNFSIISNSVIRDTRLSYRARGVLLDILSRPDNWRVSADSLARTGSEGRHAILTALKELREIGYMRTEKLRKESGRFETVSIVYDTPNYELTEVQKPNSRYPQSENRTPLEVLSKKNLDTNLFEEFWKLFPRKVGKQAAERAFAKACKVAEQSVIIAGAARYADDPNRVDAFTAHPTTWLNAGRWNDEPLPERIKTGDEKRVEEQRIIEQRRAREIAETLRWQKEVEEAKKNAVPMPNDLKVLLHGKI